MMLEVDYPVNAIMPSPTERSGPDTGVNAEGRPGQPRTRNTSWHPKVVSTPAGLVWRLVEKPDVPGEREPLPSGTGAAAAGGRTVPESPVCGFILFHI